MAKTNLEMWYQLQNANTSNSTGYMNEFVSSENPLRTGGHVLNDETIEEWTAKTTRAGNDAAGIENFADFS